MLTSDREGWGAAGVPGAAEELGKQRAKVRTPGHLYSTLNAYVSLYIKILFCVHYREYRRVCPAPP